FVARPRQNPRRSGICRRSTTMTGGTSVVSENSCMRALSERKSGSFREVGGSRLGVRGTTMKIGWPFLVAAALTIALRPPAGAQWIDFPTPGIPRLADGKPNLAGPAPRTHDGKPDLSGIWRAGR